MSIYGIFLDKCWRLSNLPYLFYRLRYQNRICIDFKKILYGVISSTIFVEIETTAECTLKLLLHKLPKRLYQRCFRPTAFSLPYLLLCFHHMPASYAYGRPVSHVVKATVTARMEHTATFQMDGVSV